MSSKPYAPSPRLRRTLRRAHEALAEAHRLAKEEQALWPSQRGLLRRSASTLGRLLEPPRPRAARTRPLLSVETSDVEAAALLNTCRRGTLVAWDVAHMERLVPIARRLPAEGDQGEVLNWIADQAIA
jgi:hypothetical protein